MSRRIQRPIARDGLIVRAGNPAPDAHRRRRTLRSSGRSVAARRRRLPIRWRARSSSTPARRPAARRFKWPRPCGTTARSSPPTCEADASICSCVRCASRRPNPWWSFEPTPARARRSQTPCSMLVLLDAPCSGLGTIRRDPDIRWRRQETALPALASQSEWRCSSSAARLVRPGGRLVYATCSSEPEENERSRRCVPVQPSGIRPRRAPTRSSNDPALAGLLDQRGFLRTLPFRHGLEAFFAARW